MTCPECGEYVPLHSFLSVCDKGEHEEQSYTRCPHCAECIHEDDWQINTEAQ